MSFSEDILEEVWGKAKIVDSFDPSSIRKDCCGAWILFSEYGNRDSIYGWEIDHVYPKSKGGDDKIENLRPMQWENNESKRDDYPSYEIAITSDGNSNVKIKKRLIVSKRLQFTLSDLYDIK